MRQSYKSCFLNIGKAPSFSPAKGVELSIITGLNGESFMMVQAVLQPGAIVAEHKHPHEQTGKVIGGRARVVIGDVEKIVEPGDFCIFPPDVPHSAETVGDEPFVMLDVFHPVREDFIKQLKK